MKAVVITGVLALLAAGMSGCTSVSVHTDYDPAASFAQYDTYRLAPPPEGLVLSPSADAALKETLHDSLAARGIQEITEGDADLDVVWHVITQDRVSVQEYTDWGYRAGGPWPNRYGGYGMWAGAPMTYTDVNTYLEGTLVLDFVDAKTDQLVFRGTGTGTVGSPKANAKSIRTAISRIVQDFPSGQNP